MIRLPLIFAAVTISLCGQQPVSIDQWQTLDQICGRLERKQVFLVKGDQVREVKYREIPKATVRLYPWREGSPCCAGLPPLAETRTRRQGQFEFNTASPGAYWVAAYVSGHEYTTAIRYILATTKDPVSCRDHVFAIDDQGKLTLLLTIELD